MCPIVHLGLFEPLSYVKDLGREVFGISSSRRHKIVLSSYDLRDHTFAAGLVTTQNMSSETLLKQMQFRLAAWDPDRQQALNFISKIGLCMGAENGLPVLKDKLSSAIDAQVVDLDAVYNQGTASFKNGQIEDAIYAITVLSADEYRRALALAALAACAFFCGSALGVVSNGCIEIPGCRPMLSDDDMLVSSYD